MTQLHTSNGARAQLVGADGKTPLVMDVRLERVKIVAVSPHFLAIVLSRTTGWEYVFEGWPAGAEALGSLVLPTGDFGIVVHRDDFPRVLPGRRPEIIACTVRQRELADPQTHAGAEGC